MSKTNEQKKKKKEEVPRLTSRMSEKELNKNLDKIYESIQKAKS